jgi:hypothetical protein
VCGWRVETPPLGWGKCRVQFQSQASPTPLIIYKRVNLEVMKVPKKLETKEELQKLKYFTMQKYYLQKFL